MVTMDSLSTLDWTICIGYLLLVIAMGSWFARKQHTNEDYFVGGRSMHWLPIGLSLFASIFSSLSFVGLPREAAYEDYHLYLAVLIIPLVAMPIVSWIFVPLYLRLRVTSAYEYLELRFNRPLRLVASLLCSLYMFGWMGAMLLAVGVILQAVLGLNETQLIWTLVFTGLFATVYTTFGGVKAVIWTDVLQAVTLGGGMLVVLFLTVGRIDGGWSTVWEVGTRYDKFQMFEMRWDPTDRGNFFSACAFGVFVYISSFSVFQGAVQRYVAMPTVKVARTSLVLNATVTAAICLLFFLVGTVLFCFYHHALPVDAVANSGFPELAKQDQLLPLFVMQELPQIGLMGLFLAGLFAAAMSSVDSGINCLTALVVSDWLSNRKLGVGFSRVLCFVFGTGVILTAVILQTWESNVFDTVMMIAGTFFGPLFGIFLLGIFVKRANSYGAAAGVLASVATVGWVLWTKDTNQISHWWYAAFGCLPVLVVGTLVSLALRWE
jgi:SSS family solute:Na+ symporter